MLFFQNQDEGETRTIYTDRFTYSTLPSNPDQTLEIYHPLLRPDVPYNASLFPDSSSIFQIDDIIKALEMGISSHHCTTVFSLICDN